MVTVSATQIRLPEAEMEIIKQLARQQDRSVNWVLQQAVRHYLNHLRSTGQLPDS